MFVNESSKGANGFADDEPWHLYASGKKTFDGRPLVGLNVEAAWRRLAGRREPAALVRVVIFDTGVEIKHPSLRDNIDERAARDFDHSINDGGRSIGEGGRIENKFDAHGTASAGIVGATRHEGASKIIGVAPNCKMVPVRISTNFDPDSLINALCYAQTKGDLILLPRYIRETVHLTEAISTIARTMPVVCAAGNDGRRSLVYPASIRETIAVGASNELGYRSTYSQCGADLDVVALSNDLPNEDQNVTRLDVDEVRLRMQQMSKESRDKLMSQAEIDPASVENLTHDQISRISSIKGWNSDRLGVLSIATTDNLNGYGYNSDPPGAYCKATGAFGFGGTSAAAAQVAGVVALMLTANDGLKGHPEDVRTILHRSASHQYLTHELDGESAPSREGNYRSLEFGFGLLDADKAVELAVAWANPKAA